MRIKKKDNAITLYIVKIVNYAVHEIVMGHILKLHSSKFIFPPAVEYGAIIFILKHLVTTTQCDTFSNNIFIPVQFAKI